MSGTANFILQKYGRELFKKSKKVSNIASKEWVDSASVEELIMLPEFISLEKKGQDECMVSFAFLFEIPAWFWFLRYTNK